MKVFFQRIIVKLKPDSDIFWIGGLVIFCLFVLRRLISIYSESSEWIQYVSTGTLFFFIIASHHLFSEKISASKTADAFKIFFSILFTGYVFYIDHSLNDAVLVGFIVCAQIGFLVLSHKKEGREKKAFFYGEMLFLGIASCLFSVKLLWWGDFSETVFSSPFSFMVFVVCLFLTAIFFFPISFPVGFTFNGKRQRLFLDCIAIFLFVLLSVRMDPFVETSLHHWGVFVAPAEMVRQGGWLLWDVPSQYGFLGILAIAWLPFKSCWQSMYVLNASLFIISAFIFYRVFRLCGNGLWNYLFSVIVTVAALFLLPGWAPELSGAQAIPSVSPLRFFWLYAMIGFIVREFQMQKYVAVKWHLFKGSLIWTFACLWSVESAFFVSMLWIPYCILFLFSTLAAGERQLSFSERLKKNILLLAIPSGMLISVTVLVGFIYVLHLGHLPDLRCFFDHALGFTSGFGAEIIDPEGNINSLLFVFFIIISAVIFFAGKPWFRSEFIILFSLLSCLWAVSSYFIGRSHDNNITNLSPVFFLILAVCFALIPRKGIVSLILGFVCVPIFTVSMVSVFSNQADGRKFLSSLAKGYHKNVEDLIGNNEEIVQMKYGYTSLILLRELMERAQMCANEPVAYFTDIPLQFQSSTEKLEFFYWLPLQPVTLVEPLPAERALVYASRFVSRFPSGGWIVRNKFDFKPDISGFLKRTHILTKSMENSDWEVSFWEPRADIQERTGLFMESLP